MRTDAGMADPLNAGIGVDEHLEQLASSNDVPMPADLSLVVHLPFCKTLCYHCAKNKKVSRNRGLMGRYIDAVIDEVAFKAAHIASDRRVQQLWIVGGSPLYSGAQDLIRVVNEIERQFSLNSATGRHFLIDADPRYTDGRQLAHLAMSGFNALRISLPSMSRVVQDVINRRVPAEKVSAVVLAARRLGYRDLTIKTQLGLPGQSLKSVSDDIEWFSDLGTDNIIIERYRHNPDSNAAQRLMPSSLVPAPALATDMYRAAHETLVSADFRHLGFGHYSRRQSVLGVAQAKGRLQRAVIGYLPELTTDTIGIGAGSISRFGNGLFLSANSVERYMDDVHEQGISVASGFLADPRDECIDFIVERILCSGYCEISDWEKNFDRNFERFLSTIQPCIQALKFDNLLTVHPGRLALTSTGRENLGKVVRLFAGVA